MQLGFQNLIVTLSLWNNQYIAISGHKVEGDYSIDKVNIIKPKVSISPLP